MNRKQDFFSRRKVITDIKGFDGLLLLQCFDSCFLFINSFVSFSNTRKKGFWKKKMYINFFVFVNVGF